MIRSRCESCNLPVKKIRHNNDFIYVHLDNLGRVLSHSMMLGLRPAHSTVKDLDFGGKILGDGYNTIVRGTG